MRRPTMTILALLLQAPMAIVGGAREKSSITPVPNLEASLAASEAQSTVVAVCCKSEESVVIVTRTPPSLLLLEDESVLSLNDNEAADTNETTVTTGLLSPLSAGPVVCTSTGEESRILYVLDDEDGLVLAMTGFAPDVHHLSRFAANCVWNHHHSSSSSVDMTHQLVRNALAKRVQGAAFGAQTRPFGVQALLVGSTASHITERKKSRIMQLYTVDPSGGWRHWCGGGTAIGKRASLVRKHLHGILLQGSSCRPSNWQEALEVALRAMIEEEEGDNKNFKGENNKNSQRKMDATYDAIVVFGNSMQGTGPRCATICHDVVKNAYRKVMCKMNEAEMNKLSSDQRPTT